MSLRIGFAFLAILLVVSATPVERKRRMARPENKAPSVVDIPAGVFDEDSLSSEPVSKISKVPLEVQESQAEFISPSLKAGQASGESAEDDALTPTKDDDSDSSIFGFRVPTVFVIRRPIFRDPIASFTPFQSFRPFSGFGEPRPVVTDVSTDKEDRYDSMNQMEGMLKRMQQQMSSLWGSFLTPTYQRPFRPVFPSFESSEIDNSNETSVLDIDKLPANYSNSTSETKVVNGHVVEVNKTIHKISSGNNNSGFFSFQVINVRPTPGPTTAATPEAALESEHSVATEVKPESTPSVESEHNASPSSDPAPSKADDPTQNEVGAEDKNTFRYLVSDFDQVQKPEDSPEYEFIPQQRETEIRPRSLSGDLRVNKLMEQQRLRAPYFQINPDVEYVDI